MLAKLETAFEKTVAAVEEVLADSRVGDVAGFCVGRGVEADVDVAGGSLSETLIGSLDTLI